MKRDFSSLFKRKVTSVYIYNCFEWDSLQTDFTLTLYDGQTELVISMTTD